MLSSSPPSLSGICLNRAFVSYTSITRECTVPRHFTCTSDAFQFHLRNDASFHNEMKLRYSNSVQTYRKLKALCISANMQAFGCDYRKGNILLQLLWNSLALMHETKNFLFSLSRIPTLSLFYPLSQQSRIPEDCSKNVNQKHKKDF